MAETMTKERPGLMSRIRGAFHHLQEIRMHNQQRS